ncbi:MAG: thiamine pyrophosphate-requiring protein, partial [Deltaproteobacteria bacterium]|nr:thiamine pyrophosphate-requiring protein [Deltaproteobacteria bacterium]
ILVLPSGYPRRVMNVFPNFNASLNFQHVTKICEPLTRGIFVSEVMRRAFAQLRNGRGAPALIEFPVDVFGEEVREVDVFGEEVREPLEYTPSFRARSAPDPSAVVEVAKVLAEAENPVIYAGQGVHYAKAWKELKELAELLSIPVCTSLEGKSAFPENHALALGTGGRTLPRAVRQFLQNSDVILGIGCSFTRTAFGVAMPKGKTIIHATLDTKDLDKDIPAHYALIGDAQLTLLALLDEMRDGKFPKADARKETVPAEIRSVKEAWLAEWMPKLTSNDSPITPYRVIWDLMQTVDRTNTIITHDAGSPRDQLSPFWEATEPLSYIGWGKTTQLGYGLGLNMGAKLTRPEKLCINVMGDAAIGFTGMDFETAVRERLPILSILFNNFSMAIEIPIMPVSTEKFRSTDISGHYADMAKAFGGYGERISDPGEIIPAIKRGIEATENGQPAMLEFLTSKELALSTF